jgi:hypothetical protein
MSLASTDFLVSLPIGFLTVAGAVELAVAFGAAFERIGKVRTRFLAGGTDSGTPPAASNSPDQRPCAKEPQTQRANMPTVIPALEKTLDGYNNFGCHMKMGVTIYVDFIHTSASI